MRRMLGHCVGASVVGLLATVSAATIALGATPKQSAHYSGSGRLCQNNAPKHRFTTCLGQDKFSLRTSADGKKVLKLKGFIGPIYCGGSKSAITATQMTINPKGRFAFSFSQPNKVAGKVTGTNHVTIRGHFIDQGKKVKVFYRLVVHFKNTPHSQDCGAQVSGKGSLRKH